jgi:hypothetical protein
MDKFSLTIKRFRVENYVHSLYPYATAVLSSLFFVFFYLNVSMGIDCVDGVQGLSKGNFLHREFKRGTGYVEFVPLILNGGCSFYNYYYVQSIHLAASTS